MTAHAASATQSFAAEDVAAMTETVQALLDDTHARFALVLDRSGRLVTAVGAPAELDTTTFSTLTAADFSANDQLARLIGETDFTSLLHQGEKDSLYVTDVAKRLLFAVVFDARATVGLVRLRAKAAVDSLATVLDAMNAKAQAVVAPPQGLLAGADAEIDMLFN